MNESRDAAHTRHAPLLPTGPAVGIALKRAPYQVTRPPGIIRLRDRAVIVGPNLLVFQNPAANQPRAAVNVSQSSSLVVPSGKFQSVDSSGRSMDCSLVFGKV